MNLILKNTEESSLCGKENAIISKNLQERNPTSKGKYIVKATTQITQHEDQKIKKIVK